MTEGQRARPRGAQEYKGNGKHDWEVVAVQGTTTHTQRLRVPGGWLYMTNSHDPVAECIRSCTVFVPVPEVVGYAV